MIVKDKNKLKPGAKIKILMPGLILIVLAGLFSATMKVSAQDLTGNDFYNQNFTSPEVTGIEPVTNQPSSSGFLTCDELGPRPKLQHLLIYVTCIISTSVIPLIFALAIAMFVWGVVQYVINSSEEVKKEKGKQFMIWGIIALTVMVSVWGLVRILGNTFGIEYAVPQVKVNK